MGVCPLWKSTGLTMSIINTRWKVGNIKMKSSRPVKFLGGLMDGETHELPYGLDTVTLDDQEDIYTIVGDYAMTDPDKRLERVSYIQVYGMEFLELAGPGIVMGVMQRVLYDHAKAIPGTTIWSFDTDWDTNLQTIEAHAYAFKEGIE